MTFFAPEFVEESILLYYKGSFDSWFLQADK